MKYAIFSDIHSNFEALKSVLEEIEKENVDEYICCGDIVGYGPEPNECVELLINIKNIKIVAGNHDRAAVGLFDIEWFNDNAKAAISWTSSVLTEENKNFLRELPEKIVEENFTVVHGSPREPISEYLIKTSDMYENLNSFDTQICFIGHSHSPFVYTAEDGKKLPGTDAVVPVVHKTIINAGSVGQPRDGDNRSSFITLENNNVNFHRVKYNVESVQDKMKKVNLPEYLIKRLEYGK